MLCVLILYISGGTYKFKVDSELQIFWEIFHGSVERKSPKKYFLYFVWRLAWGSNLGFTSNKPTNYLLDYGDFTVCWLVRCKARGRILCQVQNEIWKKYIFLRGFTLNRFLAKILRVNKTCLEKVSQKSVVRSRL